MFELALTAIVNLAILNLRHIKYSYCRASFKFVLSFTIWLA